MLSHSRPHALQAFSPEAIEFCSRKIASISGDARRALEICRLAVSTAEREANTERVSIEHVHKAMQEMFGSSVVSLLQNLPQGVRLILCAVLKQSRITGKTDFTRTEILERYRVLCRMNS